MARKFFAFPTAAELVAATRDLRVDDAVQVSDDIACLLQPVQVGGRTVGNRLAIHPMEGCDGELDGNPGELTVRRWERFGAGGCKLIWGEAVAVLDEARANPRQLCIHSGSVSGIAKLVESLRAKHREHWGPTADRDLLTGCQLTHSGRYSFRKPLIVMRDRGLDPLTLVPGPSGKVPMSADYPVLSDDDLKRVEDAFVAAAKLAVQAGFDFLDLKQCHRYLLSELLAAHTRSGPYGGSFENRTRLVRNIVARIRGEVSKDVLLATRFNMSDLVPYVKGSGGVGAPIAYATPYLWSFGVDPNHPGNADLTEPKQLIRTLTAAGMCLFNLSLANPYNNMHFGRPFEAPPLDGYEMPEHPLVSIARHFRLAGELQQAFPDVPMVGTAYSWLQHHMPACGAANVKAGRIAFVGVGRGAFAYPDFVKDLQATGALSLRKVCIADSACTALMRTKANQLGQFPSGCVPRDKCYQPIYREALAAFKAKAK